MPKTRFAVYRTNVNAAYAMAYHCGVCGDPAIAYSDDEKGLFVGLCGEGHEATVLAS